MAAQVSRSVPFSIRKNWPGAEGNAKVAQVNGAYEARINRLLDSPAGRAYVAYNAAANVKFAKTLSFQSSDGIPSVLRLGDFARTFMGR